MALAIALPNGVPLASAQDLAENDSALDTIVITARKRKEFEQDVPISTTVLPADGLDVSSVQSNADLARSVPNFSFVDLGGQSGNLANIRGVGSFSPVAPDDTSVVFYVDEVPLSVYGAAPNLMDVDHVEVLRGPQGTLFGRNTQGGAVNVVPNAPTFEPHFKATGEIGTNGYGLTQFVANGPLVGDRFAGRLALSFSTFGGDIPNAVIRGKDGALNIGAARATLLLEPDTLTSAQLTFNYNHEDNSSPRFLLRDTPDFPVSAVDPRTDIEADTYGFTLKIDHAFAAFGFHSVTALQRNTSSQYLDLTDGMVFNDAFGLPAPVFNVPGADIQDIDFGETTYLQELRLSSSESAKIAWTAGVNFFRSEFGMDSEGQSALANFAFVNGRQENELSTNSYSAFGEVTVPLTDRLKLATGLRGTHEDKNAHYVFQSNGTPGVASYSEQNHSLSGDFLTGRATVSYAWTDSLMTYASLARGYVSQGFPSISVNNPFGNSESGFPASASWTYETGFKSMLFGDRIRLNGALFFNDVKDGHLVVFDPGSAFYRVSALDYQSYGGELEAAFRITPSLDLTGGIGYTHAELVNVPIGGLSGARSGHDVPNVPALTANIAMRFQTSAGTIGLPGDLTGKLAYQYVSARAADVANTFDLDGYGIANVRLGWQHDDVSAYVFTRNLFNERYEAWGQSFGPATPTVRVGQGRIAGIGASFDF
ncbi:TonB-dependent receptor [Novosphingobium beihaiensis]|uniref:TonB-dependent receptor n=1 Tax=Novosphingobium beihaiensis TaxID=2930389 RepID=A0ABT0BUU6_9SPHN|nr:TonB-dependent receptor [Novosphingobium beihaiensis]MCJ2188840.1 TonB-dependent receptor [Novosphingobium beihaiensis]